MLKLIDWISVIWTAKDQTILAAFNFKDDSEDYARTEGQWHWDYDEPKTIYEFDASTLQTVRAPFEGHTNIIGGLALSFDGALLASASRDRTIKLWAFESRQLLASFDVRTTPDHLIFSPNSYQLAYTTWSDKIYICDTPPHILATIQSAQEAQPNINAATNPRLLDSNATHRPISPPYIHRNAVPSSITFAKYFLFACLLFELISFVILWISLLIYPYLTRSLPPYEPRIRCIQILIPTRTLDPYRSALNPLPPLQLLSKHDFITY
ncbi:uncharacterized protein F5147DRAFT_384816 [Suillus discolor]|uniref:WD40 repeat-like protein n=1 Tax=Suillus discolor TaxID=1912936 RepID=A0A9P7JYA9_9AGAM|nr:uncharacterized protein F5147DRAFT_384816 [Suillus discolor]KAG2115931.1 hypothetical protein F5147DRAFT_384816 [Suillus discolor]